MKQKAALLFLAVVLLMPAFGFAQKNACQLIRDFTGLEGTWKGSLTYLDYQSGNPYTMPADLEIRRIGKTDDFNFIHIYPDEKNANSTEVVSISKDDKTIGTGKVVSREKLADGNIRIITENKDKDGNEGKEATIRQTYTLGKSSFSIRKDVLFTGDSQWIKRHEYTYMRK